MKWYVNPVFLSFFSLFCNLIFIRSLYSLQNAFFLVPRSDLGHCSTFLRFGYDFSIFSVRVIIFPIRRRNLIFISSKFDTIHVLDWRLRCIMPEWDFVFFPPLYVNRSSHVKFRKNIKELGSSLSFVHFSFQKMYLKILIRQGLIILIFWSVILFSWKFSLIYYHSHVCLILFIIWLAYVKVEIIILGRGTVQFSAPAFVECFCKIIIVWPYCVI